MSTNAKRQIEFVIKATDAGASATASRVSANVRKAIKDAEQSASIPLAGGNGRLPMAFPRAQRTGEEQELRDRIAGRIRAQREQNRREEMSRQIDKGMRARGLSSSGDGNPLTLDDFSRGESASARDRQKGLDASKVDRYGNALNQVAGTMRAIGRAATVVEAAIKGAEIATGLWQFASAAISGGYKEQVAAAENMRNVIGDIPLIGGHILSVGKLIHDNTIDRVRGEGAYVTKLKEATDEQLKQNAALDRRIKRQREGIDNAEKGVHGMGREDNPYLSEEKKLANKINADQKALNELAKSEALTSRGKLTGTGQEVIAEGNRRIANDRAALHKMTQEREKKEQSDEANLAREHSTKMIDAQAEANAKDLELRDRHYEARIAAIRAAMGKEEREIQQRYDEETKGGTESLQKINAASKRASESRAMSRVNAREDLAGAVKDEIGRRKEALEKRMSLAKQVTDLVIGQGDKWRPKMQEDSVTSHAMSGAIGSGGMAVLQDPMTRAAKATEAMQRWSKETKEVLEKILAQFKYNGVLVLSGS